MSQQASPPTQPTVPASSPGTCMKSTSLQQPQCTTSTSAARPAEKPSEQPQGGFISFFKSALLIEESTPGSKPQDKAGSASLSGSTAPNMQGDTGASSLLGQVESSRFGSSGNLSQASSQLSETGQESIGGSGLEESFHSYHSTSFRSNTSGQQTINGHLQSNVLRQENLRRPSVEIGRSLNGSVKNLDHLVEKRSNKLLQSFPDDGPPLPFSPSRIHWLKAINKVRVQLQESLSQCNNEANGLVN
ncbi:hypothetical protein DPEC_G00336580 [Dallia pectoralis]|uniref:Uncharacterized protein n=1 Tax=Dallia pectoralis TaxID=75939 RepID=A0ACC2F799_DALPE|nr:hypothetical protein DPEC_G00336580 [Dallia pectoralis]